MTQLLARILQVHPEQALWIVTYLANSRNAERAKVGEAVFELATHKLMRNAESAAAANDREGARAKKATADTLSTARLLFKQLVNLATTSGSEARDKVRLSTFVPDARRAEGLLVPTRAALTAALDAGGNKPQFSADAPRIARFLDDVDVLNSKARPKKLTLDTSAGRRVRLLCKREKEGDLRKDARVNDFNQVVNRLLDRDPAARRRGLRLRTFAVVILDEECGLMEWVPRTRKLRQVCEAAY